jgi:cytochrome b subunit of formate dehydrogenase
MSMTSLLIGTFAVFWVHTLLWMFRGFVENREKRALLHAGHAHHAIPDGNAQYRRFQRRHIFLHLTVIVSFLGLSLTGLPLKFADQQWAKYLMSFYGGTYYAGLLHRACAVLTFYYFIGALVMSIDFLFFRKDVRGMWLQRLFGPESLMPNFRDVRDIRDMVKWFLFKGQKPTFDRWTYWEKFDFLAVFWGMFAIGGSGLMLWFPEIFGLFLPGWMFNVATIVHSDEALLATGFIFTVHFFNTHGRPEKFPMDFVIFNGQISKEEFLEERGDQWKRYEEQGITEQFKANKTSGVLYDFFFKGFGFTALLAGIACLVLMFFAFFAGSH